MKVFLVSFFALLTIPLISFANVDGVRVTGAISDPFFARMLGMHILLGLLGIMALYVLWMGLLKRKVKYVFLLWTSLASFIFLVGSWIAGGIYYVGFYGGNVKPVIKSGDYAWAHSLITETKEHIFLFLPFLAGVIFITLLLQRSELETNSKLKSSLAMVAGIAAIIGILITLAGIIMSGSAR